uniref:Ribosomal protein L5 n=1 Tax=Phaeophyceae sp. TaxID=2249243 RepID=A0A8E8PE96_9PHAE|nr:ribosomal protein L5 [Phaeophyceae sp.]
MNPLQNHYLSTVRQDTLLNGQIESVDLLPYPKKMLLNLGGSKTDEGYLLSTLSCLRIITGRKAILTREKANKQDTTKRGVGGKVTLRGSAMYAFLLTLLFRILPNMSQFEGLAAPQDSCVYSFNIKDIFAFKELLPLSPYYVGVASLQCQIHFTTSTKEEVVGLGKSLQLCFLPSLK